MIMMKEDVEKITRKIRKRARIIHILLIFMLLISIGYHCIEKLGNDLISSSYQVVKYRLTEREAKYALLEILRNKPLTIGQALQIADVVIDEKQIPVQIILGVMAQESEFKPGAVSNKGAKGLMQVIPETFNTYTQHLLLLGGLSQIHDPVLNIRAGILFLSDMKRTYGDWKRTLRAYYAGPNHANDKVYDGYALAVLAKAERYEKQLGW